MNKCVSESSKLNEIERNFCMYLVRELKKGNYDHGGKRHQR